MLETASMANTVTDWNNFARMQASERWRIQSGLMGRDVTNAVVAEADVQPGMSVLDVASGTGEPAISIATQLNGTGHVVATDISADPLKIAAERAQQRGLTNIEFKPCDVHGLDFPDNSFDRITSRLGAMFFADIDKALSEIRRVLRPGGKVVLLTWGPMSQPYFETTIGTLLRTIPNSTLPPSGAKMFRFGDPEYLSSLMKKTGFHNISARIETLPWTWRGTAQDVWGYFQSVTVPFKPLMDSIPQDCRSEIDQAVIEAIEKYRNGDQIVFTAKMVIAVGEKD
jgi:ubiquinone/menaquinone biosynthesis C-methylase UbiE